MLQLALIPLLLIASWAPAGPSGDTITPAAVAIRQHDYTKALQLAGQAIKSNPRNARAYYDRGIAYMHLGESMRAVADYEKAIVDFNRAIELNPNGWGAYIGRGLMYSRTGHEEKALVDLSQAIRINPHFGGAYDDRGNVYEHFRRYNEARDDFEKAIQLQPSSFAVHNDRGCLYQLIGKYDKALADFNESIHYNPGNAAAYYNRGNVQLQTGHCDEAIADFNRAIQLKTAGFPEYDSRCVSFSGRAGAYYQKGDYARALTDSEEAIRIDSTFSPAYNRIGWICAVCADPHFRDSAKAVQYARKACELSKWKDHKSVDTLAAAYAEAGNFEAAAKWENKALEADLTKQTASDYQTRLQLYRAEKPFHEDKPHLPGPPEPSRD
jgi:tetratricopeptide (TPR) repeat protein